MTAKLMDYVLYSYIATHYSSEDVRYWAHQLGYDVGKLDGSVPLEPVAKLINACRQQGTLDGLAQVVITHYTRFPKWQEQVGRDPRIMKLIESRNTFDEDESIVIAVAPDIDMVINSKRVPSATFLSEQIPLSDGLGCYVQVAKLMEHCKNYCVVLGQEVHIKVPHAGVCLAEIAFDCAFFRDLPIWIFHPQSAGTKKTLVRRLRKKTTELGRERSNTTLIPYSDDLDLLTAVNSAITSGRNRNPSLELLTDAVNHAMDKEPWKSRFDANAVNKEPLAVWERKLAFLEEELARTADPLQKFELVMLIEEAKQKIKEFRSTRPSGRSPVPPIPLGAPDASPCGTGLVAARFGWVLGVR